MKGRHSKVWWATLTPEERRRLTHLMTSPLGSGGGWNIPEDCGYCGACGNLCLGGGRCLPCLEEEIALSEQADLRFLSLPVVTQ